MMRSHHASRLGSSIVAAASLLALAAPAVHAQPGYGADPFWPYNNQYTPYTSPMGPADPAAGGHAGEFYSRDGLRGANQFQNYLDDLQGASGPGRNLSDRSNIGMPYYRSAVDPSYTTERMGPRQYQPNVRSAETFEESQRRVSDIYLRYFSERDPAKRAELLRQYRAARRESSLALSGRGRSPSGVLESETRREAGLRRGNRAGSTAPAPGMDARSRLDDDRFGPAPEVPAFRSRRPGATPRRSTPTDILNRSRAMDRERSGLPSVSDERDSYLRPRGRGLAPASPSSGATPSPRPTPDVDDEP